MGCFMAIVYQSDSGYFYVYLRKHYCPKCKTRLKVDYTEVFYDKNSAQAREYKWACNTLIFFSDVEVRTKCFYCLKCHEYISFADMKKHEAQQHP